MRFIGKLFMLIGLLFISFSIYKWYDLHSKEAQSLQEAKQLIQKPSPHNLSSFQPKKNETIGILRIPSIHAEIPIIEGTSPDDLEKGVGHYSDTKFPGSNDQILLSGHRDTVFRKMGDVKVGDHLIVELPYGTFTYEMTDAKIVPADDTSIIRSTYPNEELVVSTCYPFRYVGDAPDRYILYATPVKKK